MSISNSNTPFHQLDLALLRHFFAVSSFGGFSKASRATGISQPALSLGLKKLEKTLGVTLIERGEGKFGFTKEGLSLFTLCQRFEANLGVTLNSFQTGALETRRRLRVGTALSIGFGPFVSLCFENSKAKESMEIDMVAQNTFQLLNDLSEGSLDAALVPDDVYDSRLNFKRLWKDRVIFAISKNDPLEFGKNDWEEKLTSLPLLTYPRETPMRALVDKVCADHRLRFQTVYSANSVDALKLLVSRKIGGAFVLRSLVTEELRSKAIREVEIPIDLPKTGVSLATRPGEHGDSISKLIGAAIHV